MPRYEVELRQWVEFSTVAFVDASSRSRAGDVAMKEENLRGNDWNKTGKFCKITVAYVSGEQ